MASRLTLSFALVLGLSAPAAHAERTTSSTTATTAEADSQRAAARSAAVKESLGDGTLHGGSVSGDLLQIIGQIVVDRATQAGLDVLADKIEDALGCDKATSYARTCKILRDVRIEDLLASPRVLLDSAVLDLAALWRTKLAASKELMFAVNISMGVSGVLALWGSGQKSGAGEAIRQHVVQQLAEVARLTKCPADTTESPFDLESTRAAWGVAMCLAEPVPSADGSTPSGARARLTSCDLAKKLAPCFEKPLEASDSVVRVANDLKTALAAGPPLDVAEGLLRFVTNGVAARIRDDRAADPSCFKRGDTARDRANNLCAALVEDFDQVTIGLLRQDWNRFVAGAVASLTDYGDAAGNAKLAGTKFFQLLAAIGQYALTYKTPDVEGTNTEVATKARREVVESLVKQMTNRSERSGWIVSLGGSFGFAPAYRRELAGDARGYSLVALPLGVGVQHYPKSADSAVGFHAQLGVLDLGQYVTLEDDHQMTVGTPDPKASFALSATVGVWGLSRSVPLFVGAHAGLAPFVLESGRPEYYVGAMLGAYVPLLDF